MEYIGGVPQSIKCDNLRSAVIKSNRYEPQFTEAMEYVAAHYNTTVLAARVGKPRDKSSVEKAVDLAYKRIYAPLRHYAFYSRKKLFEEEEKQLLSELPSSRYEIKHITFGKVQRNYHVIVGEDYHQYSVPFILIGKKLKIKSHEYNNYTPATHRCRITQSRSLQNTVSKSKSLY